MYELDLEMHEQANHGSLLYRQTGIKYTNFVEVVEYFLFNFVPVHLWEVENMKHGQKHNRSLSFCVIF